MKSRRGFTLIELLVVIAIIGILSTIALVNLRSARQNAEVAAVEATMMSLVDAIKFCHLQGYYAVCTDTGIRSCSQTTTPLRKRPRVGQYICGQCATGGLNCTVAPLNLGNWPALAKDGSWTYDLTAGQDVAAATFSLGACEGIEGTHVCNATGWRVDCNEFGCIKSQY